MNPKVFISYSHDSPEHVRAVLAFSDKLRSEGIDTRLDLYASWPDEGWPRWMERHLVEADFVLMVCTETYRKRVTGEEQAGIGQGVCWEANLIYNQLYSNKQETSKYIPVLLEGGRSEHIPLVLRGHSFYEVHSEAGYQGVYRHLTNQPAASPGPLGQLRKLEPLNVLWAAKSPDQDPSRVEGKSEVSRRFFISYPHGEPADENLARFLHTKLVDAGHESFIDIGIPAGADWVKEIRRRIEWCDCLVLLLSEKSMQSEMVHTEARLAHLQRSQNGKPIIIPVRVCFPGPLGYELHRYVGHLQFLEWTERDDSKRTYDEILRGAGADQGEATVTVRLLAESDQPTEGESQRPQPSLDPRSAAVPGGTIRYDDPYYVRRAADEVVLRTAADLGQTLVIKGPRQRGKSSVLLHYLSECQQHGKKITFVDFQVFSEEDFSSYGTFLSRLAMILMDRLRIEGNPPAIKSQFEMTTFLERTVMETIRAPLVIAFDEVDVLFSRAFRADFFSMLRMWHNNRSPLTPQYDSLDLALVISTEPYLLIDVANRSPFNVGRTIEVTPFEKGSFLKLNDLYPGLLSAEETEELWMLLEGHPYLSRLAYYRLVAPDKCTFRELYNRAAEEHGPFGDHLRALLFKLHEKPELLASLKRIIEGGEETQRELYDRLHGAGLVVRDERGRMNPANLLYARYFQEAL